MNEFPYTGITGRMKPFFEKIQSVGKPPVVDKAWLKGIGFTETNAPTLIPVLKHIGFVDHNGKPTDRWQAYRNHAQSRRVLAQGIVEGYTALFEVYPDAYRLSDSDLSSFFSARTDSGADALGRTVRTFKALCEMADFAGVETAAPQPAGVIAAAMPVTTLPVDGQGRRATLRGFEGGMTVNINIQLALPETMDEAGYDKFFAALKTNLLS